MSTNDDYETKEQAREDYQKVAAAFGTNTDPLREIAGQFENDPKLVGIDPFEVFIQRSLLPDDPADRTLKSYERAFSQWKAFMRTHTDRHPVGPSAEHVERFIQHRREEHGNSNRTIKFKLQKLSRAYGYWQKTGFPHPSNWDPFDQARESVNLKVQDPKEPPNLTVEDLAAGIEQIKHVRDRAMVILQPKLAMRATAVTNIRLADINLTGETVRRHFPELGTHPKVEDRPNAIYIPSRYERDGNKSYKDRILPLDEETRRALRRYLLVRPENDDGWLFLSKTNHGKLTRNEPNRAWKEGFPEFEETDDYRGITSHYGRHFFSTWWDIREDVNTQLVKWMRGDKFGNDRGSKESIDHYRHVYYDDIEDLYRRRIFKLNL